MCCRIGPPARVHVRADVRVLPDHRPLPTMTTDRALFALALLHIEGVGRVTAGRLLEQFDDFDDLHRYPREQVLHRIKGARNGEALVNNLFDDAFLSEHLTYARGHVEKLQQRGIDVIVRGDDDWPSGFEQLEDSNRPAFFYAYGATANLNSPGAAVFARPPLQDSAFEWAQDLVRGLLDHERTVISGVATGFDNVVQKLCADRADANRSIMVTNCGLAKIPSGLRSTAGQAIRSGSLMVSSFPMAHGPYDHDDYERALLQAALATVSVFVEPRPDTSEWRAMQWALKNDRRTYVLPGDEHEPPEPASSITPQTPIQDIILPELQ